MFCVLVTGERFVFVVKSMTPVLKLWLDALKPKPLPVSGLERMRSGLGACLGIGFTAVISLMRAVYHVQSAFRNEVRRSQKCDALFG